MNNKYIELLDAHRIKKGKHPDLDDALPQLERNTWTPNFRLTDVEVGEWKRNDCHSDEKSWLNDLVAKADRIAENKLSYFHLREHYHGKPIRWNKDHGSIIDSPICLAQSIDYRDINEAGDCKLVWEPNRHQHLVVLGRAYRAGGNKRYTHIIQEHIQSWLEQCPYGYGMNWRSPMELAIRLINWVWAIDLTWESGIFTGQFRDRLFHSIYLHLYEITRKYSKGSSANNHLIGEAGGVFITTSYFPQLKNAVQWQEESFEILVREIELQTFADGGNKELALEYQYFVLQFFLLCGLVGRWSGKEFPDEYWQNVEKQLFYIGTLQEGGGRPVFFGDADDGYVLNLGDSHTDPRPLIGAGALLFSNGRLKTWAPEYSESLRWLFGAKGRNDYDLIESDAATSRLRSHAFRNSGFYKLQSGHIDKNDQICVLFDCGELGFGKIAAHGHSDALSFTLKAFGDDILIDPGTYDYFTYPAWRDYFRSTIAHNTLEVDGVNQSEMLGLFLWGKRAHSRCLEWKPGDSGGIVQGEHDGYTRLSDPVTHRRTLILNADEQKLQIKDELIANQAHTVRLAFHFSPSCSLEQSGDNTFMVTQKRGCSVLMLDSQLKSELFVGCEVPILGWASDGYHRKEPCPVIVASAEVNGSAQFCCAILMQQVKEE